MDLIDAYVKVLKSNEENAVKNSKKIDATGSTKIEDSKQWLKQAGFKVSMNANPNSPTYELWITEGTYLFVKLFDDAYICKFSYYNTETGVNIEIPSDKNASFRHAKDAVLNCISKVDDIKYSLETASEKFKDITNI